MLRMKKAIVICREVNRQTGQIAVYVVPMEIDEHTVVRLSLRSMFNPELRYFFVYEDVYQEQKQEIAAMAATPLVYALHAADMRAEQKENAQQ